MLINCSKGDRDDSPRDCIAYSVYVSDNCDCDNFSCKSDYWTTIEEYNRLLTILNGSSEPCKYIYANDWKGIAFEGYLLELNILNIEPCLTD